MPLTTPAIILCTLNAKYIHASLGLRYLLANMTRHGGADLRSRTVLREFTIARPVQEIAEALLAELGEPVAGATQIIGLGVYIWNTGPSTELVRLLKALRPSLKIVLGGPEVSYEWEDQEIVRLADHLITGWGDVSFPKLCRALLHGPQPLMKVIPGEQAGLDEINLPYAEYSADEIQLGVLKRLRGTPIARHSDKYGMIYDAQAPYTVQQTAAVDAATLQRFTRLARYWDLLANSGRFKQSLPLLLVSPSPFAAFLAFSDWLWVASQQKTSGLTPEILLDHLFEYLTKLCGMATETVRQTLFEDYQASGARANPICLRGLLKNREQAPTRSSGNLASRQRRHSKA